MAQRQEKITQDGGISGLRAIVAQQTGYANVGDEGEINAFLKKDDNAADDTLVEMTHVFGQEKLQKMRPSEFYRLYRDFSLGKN